MATRTALISGAGIAGATLAHHLVARGIVPTVVETAPCPRPGGQAVDVRGPAMTVADRMGIGPELRAARTRMRGMSMVDPEGRELMSTTSTTLTGGPVDGPDVEVLRDDLAALLLGTVDRGVAEVVFGDRVVALHEHADGVEARFASGARRRFDLVIGADGLHSSVRDMAFDAGSASRRHLGSHLAVYTMPNRFGLDRWQVFCRFGEVMVGLYTARDNREVRVNLGFTGPESAYDRHDREAQQAVLRSVFADAGWWVPTMLEGMAEAEDFYLAPMTQIHLPRWSAGRVVLVGDAAWCPTPMSGQGTSLAMVGAYVLAGELARAGDDVTSAFEAYERRLRGFVTANQELALINEKRTGEMLVSTGEEADTAVDGFDAHWVATAATAIELPDYAVGCC